MSEEPTKAVSPLRQRMIDDMRMRKLSDKTQIAYIRAVRRLARFLGRSPDTATAEDVRRFQLHLVDVGMSAISINATITALKFFFEATVGRPELGTKMRPVRVEHKLPVAAMLHCRRMGSFMVERAVVSGRVVEGGERRH